MVTLICVQVLKRGPTTDAIKILVLSPTRELAHQIAAEAHKLIKHHTLTVEVRKQSGDVVLCQLKAVVSKGPVHKPTCRSCSQVTRTAVERGGRNQCGRRRQTAGRKDARYSSSHTRAPD